MSYGALLTYEDGTPFYLDGTRPMALVRKQRFNVSATDNSGSGVGIALDTVGVYPFLYFVIFDQPDGWGYMTMSDGVQRMVVGAFSSGTVSGTIYCFGVTTQVLPAGGWGVAVWDANGTLILTNETNTLKGVGIVVPSGPADTTAYLNQTVGGKVAIIPGRCGADVYQQMVGGNPITQIITYSTGAYFDGSNTLVRSRPMGRSSASIPLNSSKGNGYAPAFINCAYFD